MMREGWGNSIATKQTGWDRGKAKKTGIVGNYAFQDSVVTNEKLVQLNMVGIVRKNVSVSYSAAICMEYCCRKQLSDWGMSP